MYFNIFKSTIYKTVVLLSISTTAVANSFVDKANLPTDVDNTCAVTLADWFPSDHVVTNGWVEPADSTNPIFNAKYNTQCDFFKWGSQMFLWLTSGVTDRHVFNYTPNFYNISVENTNSKRQFLRSNGTLMLTVRDAKIDGNIELGQAGGDDVLLSQDDSLVYYGIHANDIFTAYTIGQKKGAFKNQTLNDQFPVTDDELDTVVQYAYQNNIPVIEPKALAMELKTSWVDAATISPRSDYVITEAIVPTFDRSNPKGPWPLTGKTRKELALVGMHVVGSVNGHPELIWATFEHVNNVPDNTYTYVNANKKNTTVTYDSSTNEWVFLPQNLSKPRAIAATARIDTATSPQSITSKPTPAPGATPTTVIDAVDVIRYNPWGNSPAAQDDNSLASNTALISLNKSVLSQLNVGDIRGNYIQTGSVWTSDGNVPTSDSDSKLTASLKLSNSTMETFHQHNFMPVGGENFNPKNCFSCHNISNQSKKNLPENQISHIFNNMEAVIE